MPKKLTEVVAEDMVYFKLRNPAFITSANIYQASRKPQQHRAYHSVSRALGRVQVHDTTNHLLIVLPAFNMDVGPQRPCRPVHIDWWNLRELLYWNGTYTDQQTKSVTERGSTVLNRLKQAYMRSNTAPLDNPHAQPVSMIFEQVQLFL